MAELQQENFQYRLWGHQLASDFDLGELDLVTQTTDPDAAIHICCSLGEDWPTPEREPLLKDDFENGDLWCGIWKADHGYIMHFPELCKFLILPDQMRIECAPVEGVDDSTVAHLILDHAIPRLLSLTPGFVVFHASGIQIGDAVVAVLGQSGQGKSTLAGWFASQGYPLLTDDCLVVRWDEAAGQWLAQPSYHSVRLWPDSVSALGIADSSLREFAGYSSKKRTGREVDFRFAADGAPLTACFVLGGSAQAGVPAAAHSGPPEARALAVNEAFRALAGAVFRIDPEDPEVNRREFDVLTNLTDTVRFWALRYEREYRWLPAVRDVMIEAAQTED